MADSFIQLPADSTGKKVDTENLTVSAQSVHRERMQIAGATDVAIAVVKNAAPASGDYGLAVRGVGSFTVDDGAASLTVDDGGASLTVDGTISLGSSIPAGTNNIGDVDVITEPAIAADGGALPSQVKVIGGYDGTNVQVVKTSATGQIAVTDDGGSLTVDGSVSITGALPAGTNNIGDVDIASALPAGNNNIGDVDIASALPAGANKIGSTNHELDMASSGTALTTKFAVVDVASSGDNTIVAAVAGKKIRVLALALVASGGANTVTWKSGASTALSGGMGFAANGGYSINSDRGLFETGVNTALVLNLAAATSMDGHITYVEV